MKQRCSNPRGEKFKHYGGRGISFHPPWADFSAFLTDMGPAPDQASTLERLDVNKDYEPDNCVWAPWADQRRNKRTTQRATINGVTRLVMDWYDVYGVKPDVVFKRLRRGWDIEKAVTTPLKSVTDPRYKPKTPDKK